MSDDYIQKEREGILNSTAKDIREAYDILNKCIEENCICVFGSEEKIKENEEIFKHVINLFAEKFF